MGKFTVRINPKNGQNYLPKSVRDEGFINQVEAFSSPMTVTLLKPKAKLTEVYQSLGILRELIRLRMMSKEGTERMEETKASAKPMVRQAKGPPYPIFAKFSRRWLSASTGYSLGYLCRVATGNHPLSGAFVSRCCFRLNETETELFGP